MKEADIRQWFAHYIDTFAACCLGEREPDALLAYYRVPLLITDDDHASLLADDAQVLGWATDLLGQLRAADYDHTDLLHLDIEPLNGSTALCRTAISRRRHDGSEIAEGAGFYLVTNSPAGPRFSAVAALNP
ncbi:hypothetical protein AB0C51_08695 [Streptomyces pathocidini]|uniref:DUF6841 family protein n=1 Tax=Streptomyces pathocidini TaxID=1650571 RepID=UPI003409C743